MSNTYTGLMWPTREQTWLIKAALCSGDGARKAWEKWSGQIDFDQIDTASYFFLPFIYKNRELQEINQPILKRCEGIYRQNWVATQVHWKKLVPLLSDLSRAGVGKIVILKGMAMILRYYRDFGLRVMGDVDILIERAKIPIAASFLSGPGWKQNFSRVDIHNEEHLNRWHALNFEHENGISLDLHWSLIQENSSILTEAVLADAEELPFETIQLYAPNPTDCLIQACIHGMKSCRVPLIRWIADGVTILRQSEHEIDWDRLVDLAQRAHLSEPLSDALRYLTEQFQAPVSANAIRRLQNSTTTRFESLEYRAHKKGWENVANWFRYCMNRNLLSWGGQIGHFLPYLKETARLRSFWQIPFFALYWTCKRTARIFHD